MKRIRPTYAGTILFLLLCAQPAASQQWIVDNDQRENFVLFLKPTGDKYAKRERHDLPRGRQTPIQFSATSQYYVMLRSSGGGTYRLTNPVDLNGRGTTLVSQIVSPKKTDNGQIIKDRQGNIVYEVMNQDGFNQEDEYERFITRRLLQSRWSTTYQALNGQSVPADLSLNGRIGTYKGRNGRLEDIAYTADEDKETVTIDGVWKWGNGEAYGRFYFEINFNQPDMFTGEYWEENGTTRYSWTGERSR